MSPNFIYYPRIKVQISPDCIYYPRCEESTNKNRLGGSTYRIHFVLRSFVDMANSYDRADLRKLQKKY